jgi:hypothetical protein
MICISQASMQTFSYNGCDVSIFEKHIYSGNIL